MPLKRYGIPEDVLCPIRFLLGEGTEALTLACQPARRRRLEYCADEVAVDLRPTEVERIRNPIMGSHHQPRPALGYIPEATEPTPGSRFLATSCQERRSKWNPSPLRIFLRRARVCSARLWKSWSGSSIFGEKRCPSRSKGSLVFHRAVATKAGIPSTSPMLISGAWTRLRSPQCSNAAVNHASTFPDYRIEERTDAHRGGKIAVVPDRREMRTGEQQIAVAARSPGKSPD